jgi:predicted 3-demethylubiquinone-9 3-methyltransferase (glyoxalase superfamily)
VQEIVPHLWFDKEATEAAAFYTSLFKHSKVNSVSTITDTPSGDCDIVSFTLAGQNFMAISAGPVFKFNPSISFFTIFDDAAEIDAAWNKLVVGGKVLMPYQVWPWAKKYGWLQDKYGLSWQLSMSEHPQVGRKITPLLMYTGSATGKAKEAIEFYTGIFPNSKIDMLAAYEKGEGDQEGFLKHARFTLCGLRFMAMDSSVKHEFNFNEAISFLVSCNSQQEIDHYWTALSADPKAEQCGWLKDKFGVSWQISPRIMEEMLSMGTEEQKKRVTQAFLKMKKFDIASIEKAFEGQGG